MRGLILMSQKSVRELSDFSIPVVEADVNEGTWLIVRDYIARDFTFFLSNQIKSNPLMAILTFLDQLLNT